jgi:hypothetical protein
MAEHPDTAALMRKHVGDMVALERHVLEAVARQRGSTRLTEAPEAGAVVATIERTLESHLADLDHWMRGFGVESQAGFKQAVTRVAGAIAGLYDRVREHEVSRMLRDDYAALSLAVVSYEMLHTASLALRETHLAGIALGHLQDYPPLLAELARIIPHVVAHEVGGAPGIAAEAERNARDALLVSR